MPDYWSRLMQSRPPLMDVIQRHPGMKISILSDAVEPDAFRNSRFYGEFAKPEGWCHAAGLLFWDGPRFIGHIGMVRTEAQGDFTRPERALLEELHPHLEAAVQRVAIFDRERQTRGALQAVFAHAPEARLVLDLELTPLFTNLAAELACACWNHGPDALALKTAVHQKRFALPANIAAAARELATDYEQLVRKNSHLGVDLVRNVQHPTLPGLQARIQILQSRAPVALRASLLVELSRVHIDGAQSRSVPDFRLTPSERRVAERAAAGRSNAEIGSELALSVHTVRAHLREAFSKLGVQRRSQLGHVLSAKRP
jgi:DNA-binding CsgD family transcriptional regulator